MSSLAGNDSLSKNGAYHSSNHHKYTVDNRLYQWHLRQFLNRLYDMLAETSPRTVLDAGCGEGFVTDFIKRRDNDLRITGVDLSEEAIRYAREHFGEQARFRTGDIYDLPFPDDSFDTVLCSEVLEHLEAPGEAAAELRRVARNYVVITVPLEPYFELLNNLAQWLGLGPDPGHVNFWTKKEFQAFIEKHYDDAEFDWKHIFQLAAAEA